MGANEQTYQLMFSEWRLPFKTPMRYAGGRIYVRCFYHLIQNIERKPALFGWLLIIMDTQATIVEITILNL